MISFETKHIATKIYVVYYLYKKKEKPLHE